MLESFCRFWVWTAACGLLIGCLGGLGFWNLGFEFGRLCLGLGLGCWWCL